MIEAEAPRVRPGVGVPVGEEVSVVELVADAEAPRVILLVGVPVLDSGSEGVLVVEPDSPKLRLGVGLLLVGLLVRVVVVDPGEETLAVCVPEGVGASVSMGLEEGTAGRLTVVVGDPAPLPLPVLVSVVEGAGDRVAAPEELKAAEEDAVPLPVTVGEGVGVGEEEGVLELVAVGEPGRVRVLDGVGVGEPEDDGDTDRGAVPATPPVPDRDELGVGVSVGAPDNPLAVPLGEGVGEVVGEGVGLEVVEEREGGADAVNVKDGVVESDWEAVLEGVPVGVAAEDTPTEPLRVVDGDPVGVPLGDGVALGVPLTELPPLIEGVGVPVPLRVVLADGVVEGVAVRGPAITVGVAEGVPVPLLLGVPDTSPAPELDAVGDPLPVLVGVPLPLCVPLGVCDWEEPSVGEVLGVEALEGVRVGVPLPVPVAL